MQLKRDHIGGKCILIYPNDLFKSHWTGSLLPNCFCMRVHSTSRRIGLPSSTPLHLELESATPIFNEIDYPMKNFPKVLIVTTEAPDVLYGGLGFFHEIMWAELKKRHVPFRTCYLNAYNTIDSKMADYNVKVSTDLPFNSLAEVTSMNKAWSTREKLETILAEFKPDVISVHENWAILPFYFDLRKVQFTSHSSHIGMEHPLSRTANGLQNYWEQRIAMRQSARLVLHSNWAKNMIKQYVADDLAPASIFPIGLKSDQYPSEKISNPDGKLVVSFFGRFIDLAKGFSTFLDAIKALPVEHRKKIEPRVYGPNKMPDDLVEMGFKGLTFVQGDEKRRAFAETDIVIMPSTRESFGIVGLEALLSNCMLIATPGLGMDEYMPAECQCPSDAGAISQMLIKCIDNSADLRAKQQQGYFRKLVDKPKFHHYSMVDNYIEVWRNMAAPL